MTSDRPGVRRTEEIEEFTNRHFVHPLSRRLVGVLAPMGVHPNAVSVAGMFAGALAAAAYFQYEAWPMAVLGFALMVVWHVLDGADGQLARLTGKTSDLGRILDGVCDHLTFVLIYVSLAWTASQSFGPSVWLIALLAGISHAVQASVYEHQRQSYDVWVHGKESARFPTPEEVMEGMTDASVPRRLMGLLFVGYLRLQRRMAVVDEDLQSELTSESYGPVRPGLRAAYRAHNLRGVRRWSLLSSNHRTVAIFVACLLGNPVYFFVFEVVVLNAVFSGLRVMQDRLNCRLLADLRGVSEDADYPISSKPV